MLIIKNAIRCNICGDEIESKHRHDYVQCKCATYAVDSAMITFAVALKRRGAIRTFYFAHSHLSSDLHELIKPHLHSLSL